MINTSVEHINFAIFQDDEEKQLLTFTNESEITIGRAVSNTIAINDERGSRFHAKVFYHDSNWFIQDLGSRNGTFVDNFNIGDGAFPLQDKQNIQVGRTVMQVVFGLFEDSDTTEDIEDEKNLLKHHSGILGVEASLTGLKENGKEEADSEIVLQKGHSVIFKSDTQAKTQRVETNTTKSGFGTAEMCQIAYQIGKTEDVKHVARIALEGLKAATNADGLGLWLLPHSSEDEQSFTDIRLTSSKTSNNASYVPISVALARIVFEKQEAILFHYVPNTGTKKIKKTNIVVQDENISTVNNTLVAPIRYQISASRMVIGVLHLYTTDEVFDEFDLEYTLAIADIVGAALLHINKRKILLANLSQIRKENANLQEMLYVHGDIIGESQPIQKVHQLISRAASGKAPLLIYGESGTGKELIARAVHMASSRKSKPLVCLNCAALSESLLDSELFGHEKGAFTGASERKIGKFEAANTGTLFLDEIGEMSPNLQSKMLRVLENNAFERVGGNNAVCIDVRIITATNRDLEKEITAGRFRHDLFFRLRVLEIIVPPLRKRDNDIPILAEYFLNHFCQETGRKYTGFHPDAMKIMMKHRWPGNVRELKNIIERAVVLGSEPLIMEQDLLLTTLNVTGDSQILTPEKQELDLFIPLSLEDVERNHIVRTLECMKWNKSLVAKQLGIERTTLDRKIKRYNIKES